MPFGLNGRARTDKSTMDTWATTKRVYHFRHVQHRDLFVQFVQTSFLIHNLVHRERLERSVFRLKVGGFPIKLPVYMVRQGGICTSTELTGVLQTLGLTHAQLTHLVVES